MATTCTHRRRRIDNKYGCNGRIRIGRRADVTGRENYKSPCCVVRTSSVSCHELPQHSTSVKGGIKTSTVYSYVLIPRP